MVRLFVIFCLILQPFLATSWDLAVAVDKRLKFMTAAPNGSFTVEEEFEEPSVLSAVALNYNSNVLFVSTRQKPSGIYQINLGSDRQRKLVVEEPVTSEGRILGIVHDHVNNVLYWSNGDGGDILFIELDKPGANRTVLHHFQNKSTAGLALDQCNRVLYWTSYNVRQGVGYIESSKLDGTSHEVVLSGDMHMPTDVAVDHQKQKLYWSDDREGIYYRIERSNLDGSTRELVVNRSNHQPNSITVTSNYVYWTDVAFQMLWKVGKEKNQDGNVTSVYIFRPNKARGIISKENSVPVDCTTLLKTSDAAPVEQQSDAPAVVDSVSPNRKSEPSTEIEKESVLPNICLNGGTPDPDPNSDTKCKCLREFHGPYCEIPACYNYCVNGECYVNAQGYAQCRCYQGYHGARCQIDVCDNYCLNGGRCSIGSQGEPVCTCSGGYQGRHCEVMCSLYCQQNHIFVPVESGMPICLCNEIYQVGSLENGTYSSQMALQKDSNLETTLTISLVVVGVLCIIFIVFTIVLLKSVIKLRKRPRIKKRIIVNKNITPTPLTSRPPGPADQCEITIENCCNMNICETPCYEPQLRTSKTVSKTEEKKNLLKNMEDGESCTPCQDSMY